MYHSNYAPVPLESNFNIKNQSNQDKTLILTIVDRRASDMAISKASYDLKAGISIEAADMPI